MTSFPMLGSGNVADWVPFLSGTLHPRSGGLPAIQRYGWPLMGVPNGRRLRVYAALTTTPPRLEAASELRDCLTSLLAQTVPLEAVLLVIPHGRWRRGGGGSAYPTSLPPWLCRFR